MYVVTDAAGPVGSKVAEALLAAGEKVRVMDADAAELEAARKSGAEAWTGDVTDTTSLRVAFAGAIAAFLALPNGARRREDFCEYQEKVSHAYAQAIGASGIRYVVSQSCAGVQEHARSKFLAGLHNFEEELNRVRGLNVLHVRPAHFPEHLGAEIIESLNIVVGAIAPHVPLPIVFPEDVATFAAERMRKQDFKGCQAQELLGQRDLTMSEFTDLLGLAFGKTKLRYVQLSPRALEQWLIRVGLPKRSAQLVIEVWALANQGLLTSSEQRSPQNTTGTSIEAFLAETSDRLAKTVHRH